MNFLNSSSPKEDSFKSELHWSLCGNSSSEIIRKLGLDFDKREERTVSFYDFQDPDGRFHLFSRGIILRLRSDSEDQSSSTVKISVDSRDNFIEESTSSDNEKYKCEEDRYREKVSYHCSLSREFNFKNEPIFSDHQRLFLNKTYSSPIALEKLSLLGPVLNNVWIFPRSKGFVLEEMRLPNSTSFYDLSLRVPLSKAEFLYRENLEFLKKRNINICEAQESKTLKVLNFFKAF
jgi:hypothetical protein